jgi:hypothetical protein
MLDLYVLYACVHLIAGKHSHGQSGTLCTEGQIFFHVADCRRELPQKRDGVVEKNRHELSWLECRETRADSWLPAGDDQGYRLYKVTASASDGRALAALLAPLSRQAREAFAPGDFKRPFQRAFQGPGSWSFFILGTGSSVTAFAVSNLDGFQFADLAVDVSSASADATNEAGLDFASTAQDAGITLSYRREISKRDVPPPGGIESAP